VWAVSADIIVIGDGGGAGGGVDAWGNGGTCGEVVTQSVQIGSSTGPEKGKRLTINVGFGGSPGSSIYYNEYMVDNEGFTHPLGSDEAAYDGGDGSGSSVSWASPSGTQTLSAAGGSGGAAGGGSIYGQGVADDTGNIINFNGNAYYGGADQDYVETQPTEVGDFTATGSDGNAPGGGASACYSGTGLSNEYYQIIDQFGDRDYYYTYGYTSPQNAGSGAPGAVFVVFYGATVTTAGAAVPYAPLQQQIPVAMPRAALR
jgi:hypothetical protein